MPLPIKFNGAVASALKDRELAEKLKSAKKSTPKSNSIMDIIEKIRQDVEQNLGQFRDKYQVITDKEVFKKYIQKANENGKIAIDTETNGLNPIKDSIVGLCLYFPGEPATYVPINHVNYISDVRIEDQLTEEEVKEILEGLNAKIVYHNAPFDIRVIKHQLKIKLPVFWDTLVAGNLIDENELHGLKYLHGKYISHSEEQTFSDLFGKILFKYIPIEYAFLYAAHDAIDTYELQEWQYDKIYDGSNLSWLFENIEIPMVDVIVDLDDTGVAVNLDYVQELHDKYNDILNDALKTCLDEIDTYFDKIEKYNAIHSDKPFIFPPNISSPAQLSILFYDILKCKPVAGKKERSTDGDVMTEWAKTMPLAKAILKYRGVMKIISGYINNIPNITYEDGRIRTHFHSLGARTGRMSSSEPLNLQNIPSHNEDIRKMFVGQTTNRDVEKRSDNAYIFDKCEEIQLSDGDWVWVEKVKVGDTLISGEIVKAVKVKDFKVLIGV